MFKKFLLLWKYRKEVRAALGRQIALLEEDSAAQSLGGLTDEEIRALLQWLPSSGVFVEFGTLFGLTVKAVAMHKPNLKIIAVDNFSWNPFGLPPGLHERFTRSILANEIATGQIEIVRSSSQEFRERCRIVPDAVFFDAQHQYEAIKDELMWSTNRGIKTISGHDYGNSNPLFGVTRAVDEAFAKKRIAVVGMCWCVIEK